MMRNRFVKVTRGPVLQPSARVPIVGRMVYAPVELKNGNLYGLRDGDAGNFDTAEEAWRVIDAIEAREREQ